MMDERDDDDDDGGGVVRNVEVFIRMFIIIIIIEVGFVLICQLNISLKKKNFFSCVFNQNKKII